jgi:hypothetical protein
VSEGRAAQAVRVARLDTAQPDFEAAFTRVLHWSAETDSAIEERVAAIVADVRSRGDAAVLEYTARFDGLQAPSVAALEMVAAQRALGLDARLLSTDDHGMGVLPDLPSGTWVEHQGVPVWICRRWRAPQRQLVWPSLPAP